MTCELVMWQGAGRGMGPGTGPGAGPGAGRGTGPGVGAMSLEQRRAVMAARLKNMPPEVVKQRMEMMEMDKTPWLEMLERAATRKVTPA